MGKGGFLVQVWYAFILSSPINLAFELIVIESDTQGPVYFFI